MTNGLGSVFGLPAPNPYAGAPLCNWQGASNLWFPHSVLGLSHYTYVHSANYVFVRLERDGRRTPLYIGQSEDLAKELLSHPKLVPAMLLGGNELHVHLLAQSKSERLRIETDVRNGHHTPLNEQPSLAGLGRAAINPFGWYAPFK